MNVPVTPVDASARRRAGRLVALLAVAALVPAALAAEMVVQGRVVDVVPLTAAGNVPARDCHPARPAAGASLVELLEWDLRATCDDPGSRPAASGYRVYYEWDGRTYSQVMREPPGETVSLRVRIR